MVQGIPLIDLGGLAEEDVHPSLKGFTEPGTRCVNANDTFALGLAMYVVAAPLRGRGHIAAPATRERERERVRERWSRLPFCTVDFPISQGMVKNYYNVK